MNVSRRVRIKGAWLLVLPFLFLARPTPGKLAVGFALAIVGATIRGWAAGTIQKGRTLAVRGPYAYTRNPLYLGSFFIGLGAALAGGRWVFLPAFLVFFVWAYGKTAGQEELELGSQFGDAYRRYAASVPRFLPRLTPYRPRESDADTEQRFTLQRYRKNREYEAGLGLLLGFGALLLRMLL